MKIERSPYGKCICFDNGLRIGLLENSGEFLGIGEVSYLGTALRNSIVPMGFQLRTPRGEKLCHPQILDVEPSQSGVDILFSLQVLPDGPMEWMLHETRTRWNLGEGPPVPAKNTRLRLRLLPINRMIGDQTACGFSYQYIYESSEYSLYRILDTGTWELGGHIRGNEFWMRNAFNTSRLCLQDLDQVWSTEWYAPEAGNPSVFQFLPFQTELQGFTFTAGKEGLLLSWTARVAHIRSLFEKRSGSPVMHHVHEHCGDLGPRLQTSCMEVLFIPGAFSETERINVYLCARDLFYDTLHKDADLVRDRVSTYGMIEEWSLPDLEKYAEKGVPALAEAGVRTLALANHFKNNMSAYGVSNMCCTVDYEIPEPVGLERFRHLCDEATAKGMRVEMWANTAISTFAWQAAHQTGSRKLPEAFIPAKDSLIGKLQSLQDPFVKTPSGAIDADHYTPVFAILNLRNPEVLSLLTDGWARLHQQTGVSGFFLDSSFNLSSDKFHYLPDAKGGGGVTADQTAHLGKTRPRVEAPAAILTQFPAHLDFVRNLQRMGYSYCGEDIGVFGTHRHGPAAVARVDNLFFWADCYVDFDVPALRNAGQDPDTVFFMGLAYRMMWMLHWDPRSCKLGFNQTEVRTEDDIPGEWHLQMLKLYNLVETELQQPRLCGDNDGLLYSGKQGAVYWAFSDAKLHLNETPVRQKDLLHDREVTSDTLCPKPLHVYHLIDWHPIHSLAPIHSLDPVTST